MNNEPFRWCFIGGGTLAHQVAAEIIASGRHSVFAVYSQPYENAIAFADEFGGTVFTDAEQAMSCADGVYVVVPHPFHYQYAKQALSLGKPVLCEKPFTVNASDTKDLFRLAAEKKVYLTEGMWTWFAPVARKVKEWIDGGAVGEICDTITNHRVYVLNYAPRLTDPKMAGGALLDTGIYSITYLYRLFGKPTGVKCTGRIENGIDLEDEIDLIYPGNIVRHISLSICDPRNEASIRIVGSEADIVLHDFFFTDHADLIAKDGRTLQRFSAETSFINEFDLVTDEIRSGKTESAFVPPYATIDVMEILDECRKQIGLVYPFEQ